MSRTSDEEAIYSESLHDFRDRVIDVLGLTEHTFDATLGDEVKPSRACDTEGVAHGDRSTMSNQKRTTPPGVLSPDVCDERKRRR